MTESDGSSNLIRHSKLYDSSSASAMQLKTSAMAVANYCKKAAAAYGNIIPPLIIPDPLVRPLTSSNSDSSSPKHMQTVMQAIPSTSAQGKQL